MRYDLIVLGHDRNGRLAAIAAAQYMKRVMLIECRDDEAPPTQMLRDAARLSTRAAAGPFRSFGRIAVEPRPYQLVPLMMALKLDPVRLLIADDVGIGKTIEAAVIARELLDRGEIKRMAVLCCAASTTFAG